MATPAPVTPMFALKPQVDYMYQTDLMRNRPAGAPMFPGLLGEDLEPTIELPKSTRQPAPQAPVATPPEPIEQPGERTMMGIDPDILQAVTQRVHSVKQQEIGVPSRVAQPSLPQNEFSGLIDQAASEYGVPNDLLYSLLETESQFDPKAVSPVGAQGIAQFMPATAQELGVDPFDPNSAIPGAAKYLKRLHDKFGNWKHALAAYNAGMGNVMKYSGVPPFKETQNYIGKIYKPEWDQPQEAQTPTGVPQAQVQQANSFGIDPDILAQIKQGTGPAQVGQQRDGLFPGLDLAVGTAEVGANLVGGSLGYALGVGGYYGAQIKQRIGERLGVYEKLTPQEKDALGMAVLEDFSQLFTIEPRTRTGKAGMANVSWVMENLQEASKYIIKDAVDKEEYPTLYRNLYFISEGMLTALAFHGAQKGVGKGVAKTKESKMYTTLAKKLERMKEAKAAKNKAKADSIAKGAEAYIKKNAPDIVEVFNPERQAAVKNDFDVRRQAIKDKYKAQKDAIPQEKYAAKKDKPSVADKQRAKQLKDITKAEKKELNKLDQEWKQVNQQMLENMAKAKEQQARAAEPTRPRDRVGEAAALRQQQMAGMEGQSAIDIPRRPDPPGATASELSQRGRGFTEGEVRRPTFEPEPRRRAEGPVETQQLGGTPEIQTGETIPRSAYKVGPDGKVQKVSEVGARKTYQVDEFGKPELIENIPGERQVWKIRPNGSAGGSTLYSGLDLSQVKFLKGKELKAALRKARDESLAFMNKGLNQSDKELKVEFRGIKKEIKDIYKEYPKLEYRDAGILKPDETVGNVPHEVIRKLDDLNDRLLEISQLDYDRIPDRTPFMKKGDVTEQLTKDGQQELVKSRMRVVGKGDSTLYSGIPIDFDFAKKIWGKALDKVPIDKIYRNKKLWKETGIWAARDGSWRYELPFDKAEIRPKAQEALYDGSPMKLQILLKHKELFDAVPQLKDVIVKQDLSLDAFGEYNPKTKTITVKHAEDLGTLVHELQHGINDILDTFRGTNPTSQALTLQAHSVLNRLNHLHNLAKSAEAKEGIQSAINFVKTALDNDTVSGNYVDWINKDIARVLKDLGEDSAAASARAPFEDFNKAGQRAYNLDPGEMEARLFERRDAMTPEQRAKEAPWETLDKMLMDEGYGTDAGFKLYSGLDISRIFESIRPNRLKGVAKSMSAEQLETVRTLGMQAEKAGEPLFDHLKKNGMPTDQARKMSKVYDVVRNDRPWFGGQIFAKLPEGVRDPTRLTDNERNVNTSRKSNPKVPVGEEILYQAMSAKKPTGRLGRLGKAFTPTPWMLEKFGDAPFIKDLWHKSHAIERAVGEANQAVFAKAKELQKTYPDRKLREQAYIKMMSQEKLGRKSLVDDGMRPIDGPIQYEGLVIELNQVFKDFFDQVNHTRESLGLKPIRQVQHYLPMIAREHFLDRARKIFDGEGGAKDGTPNLVLDSPEMIQHRHTPSAMSATKFAHKKRWQLKEGVHLETDPIKLMSRYGQTANKHIHYSPLNAFVKELTSNPLHDPIRGKAWKMADHNYPMHEFLTRWSNKLAGRPNVILPDAMKFVETGARTLNRNLTLSTLGYSLRTVVIQPTALAYTMVESGVGRTMKAALDHAMFRENVPIEKSDFIANRTMDANIPALTEYILASPTGKVLQFPAKYAMEALKFVDAQAAKIAWRAAYSQYSHLGENMAIRMADRAVARTHGSGFAGDLSPIQMNALGKSLTLWQTFTINQLNWIAKDVLNLKHPERNPAQTVQKVMTYVVATELLGHLFEEGMGIEAPMPAPGHAIMESMKNNESGWETALNLLFETSEFVPMLSSGKFGSHWLGAPIDFIGKTSQTVQKDLQIVLDPSATDWAKDSARIRILTLLGRGLGVPGTGQVSKYVKAKRRGEEGIYAVMGRYEEGKTGGRKSKSKSKSKMKYTPARQ